MKIFENGTSYSNDVMGGTLLNFCTFILLKDPLYPMKDNYIHVIYFMFYLPKLVI